MVALINFLTLRPSQGPISKQPNMVAFINFLIFRPSQGPISKQPNMVAFINFLMLRPSLGPISKYNLLNSPYLWLKTKLLEQPLSNELANKLYLEAHFVIIVANRISDQSSNSVEGETQSLYSNPTNWVIVIRHLSIKYYK